MFKIFIFALKAGPLIIWNYLSWIIRYSRHPEKYSIEVRYNRVRKLVLKLLKRLNVVIKGENEYLIQDNKIKMFTPNHQSLLDPLFLIALSEKPITFVAKIEVKKQPFVGRVMRILDGELVDRSDLRQQLGVLKKVSKSLANNQISWGIFPEGTRNKDLDNVLIGELHPGTFKIILNNDIELVPVVIDKSYAVLSRKIKHKKYIVNVAFIDFNKNNGKYKNTVELRDDVYKLMCDKLTEIRSNENNIK